MTDEQPPSNEGVSLEELRQSVRNFRRLFASIVEQTEMDKPTTLESAAQAIIEELVPDLGADGTAALFRRLATKIATQGQDGPADREMH